MIAAGIIIAADLVLFYYVPRSVRHDRFKVYMPLRGAYIYYIWKR